MSNISIIALALMASFGVYAAGNSINIPSDIYDAAKKTATSQGEKLTSFDVKRAEEITKNITNYANSDDFRQKQSELKSLVYKTAGLEDKAEAEKGPELVSDQVVMFVSSSMPLQTLRNYARDLAKINGVMVMRGAVGGISKISATMKLTHETIRVNPACEGAKCKMWGTQMLIDPVLFRVYGIEQVPALIYQPNMHIQSYCDGLEKINRASEVVYGDASLQGMLSRLNQLSPAQNIEHLLTRMDKS